jgi:hypothetical protein
MPMAAAEATMLSTIRRGLVDTSIPLFLLVLDCALRERAGHLRSASEKVAVYSAPQVRPTALAWVIVLTGSTVQAQQGAHVLRLGQTSRSGA